MPPSPHPLRDVLLAASMAGAVTSMAWLALGLSPTSIPLALVSGATFGPAMMLFEYLKLRANLPSYAEARQWRSSGVQLVD